MVTWQPTPQFVGSPLLFRMDCRNPGGIFLIVFLYPLETGIEEPEKNGGTLSPAFVAIAPMMDKVPFRYAQPGKRSHAREIANGIWIWLCLIFGNLAWISCFYRKHYIANKDQTEISRKLSVPLMTQPDNNVEDGLAKTDGDDKNRNSWK